MKQRASFATRAGAIAATVGSAVGLGNIWRFPYEAGQNGGGMFIIAYVLCGLILGVPVMLAEFVIGRATHKNMQGALQQLSPGKPFHLMAYVCVAGAVVTLGISGLVTYASYFNDRTSLTRDAVTVASLDTLVAILAGVVIFPAVFSFGLQPEAGPKLIFEILPSVFRQLPCGYVWALLFFVLLIFASLTSTISLNEVAVTFLAEQRGLTRRRAVLASAAMVVPLAVVCALSFNVLRDVRLWNMSLFDICNYAASNVFMLPGGLFTALYVGWFLDRRVLWSQLTNNGTLRGYEVGAVRFCLRWVAPISLVLIFLWFIGLL